MSRSVKYLASLALLFFSLKFSNVEVWTLLENIYRLLSDRSLIWFLFIAIARFSSRSIGLWGLIS